MAVDPVLIWAIALVLYAVFILWHENWRGPLRPAEVDRLLVRLKERGETDPETEVIFERFMRADKGRQFFMLNLIKLHSEQVRHPDTNALVPAPTLLQSYFRPFMKQMLLRAGYPAYLGAVRGGYVEAWGVEPNPGWHAVGMIRYRSRRDLMEVILNPAFSDIHGYKHQAIATTLAFPAETRMSFLLTPRLWVALLLVSLASLLHLASLTL